MLYTVGKVYSMEVKGGRLWLLLFTGDLPTEILNVIRKADENDWSAELLHGACMWRSQNVVLHTFAQQFGLTPIPPFSTILQLLKKRDKFKFLGESQLPTLEVYTQTTPELPDEAAEISQAEAYQKNKSGEEHAPSPNTDTYSMVNEPELVNRNNLLARLSACLPTIFNKVVFSLEPPDGVLSPSTTPQADRAIELITWAEHPDGPGLVVLHNSYLQAAKKNG